MRKPFPAASLSVTSLIAFFASAPLTAQPNRPDPKCMEGVYTLEEFKRGGEVFRPPQASGRWVVLKGAVVWIFNDQTQASKQMNFACFGHYAINETTYSYQYDDCEVFTQTDTGITVSRKLPWEGMRPYTPVQGAEGVHLQNAESRTDFVCSADGLTYTFGQGSYRKYRRIKSD
jgi:hypothetical protein